MRACQKTCIILVTILLSAFSVMANAPTGKLAGSVFEVETGDPLPGANLYFPDYNVGATTDINGEFYMLGAPVGTNMLHVTYVGYQEKQISVTIGEDQIQFLEIEMEPSALAGDTVLVTAQASAQWQAINQQLAAKNVKNIVSSKQIQELPESNAAEAVGRLPGVSLERNGGEGNKVVIRGMGAKYSLIQIDGVNMTATGSGDRSTDLSMISPYMLEGIELTKSVMANQEATATGGIVNFRIKKAPSIAQFNVISQGGYNSLRETYSDYKLSVGGSNRFFNKDLGVYAQVDYEQKDAGSQQLGSVGFGAMENEDTPIRTNNMQLMDIFRDVERIGGAIVLDYSLPSTDMKFTNFYSRINREETRYQNNYNFEQQEYTLDYTDTPERWLTVITNSLQIDHRWKNWEINTAFSHSFSENILPAEITSNNNNSPTDVFPPDRNQNYNVDLDPETIPNLLLYSPDELVEFMHLGNLGHEESETKERDLSGELNLAYNFDIIDQLNIKLNFGAKIKHKDKRYDRTQLSADNQGGSQEFRNLVYNAFEDEFSNRTKEAWAADNMRILLTDFLDSDYEGQKFLDGKYDFGNVFDKKKFRRIHDLVMDAYDPESSNAYDITQLQFPNSNYQDYKGSEDYLAFYLMPEINIGSDFLVVPGVRYESNRTEYTGYRGDRQGVLGNWRATPVDTVTKKRDNEFFLPMIQTFYKPTDWLTFKAGYTHTLQRPDYNNIMPGWVITFQGQINNLSNFRLKPELARNWDIQMSVHSDRMGLFSVGAFHKKITNMIFWTGNKAITDTAFFDLPARMNRKIAAWATNNENDARNYGFELEWQSNFWYLPGLLKGLVMNVNYTRNKSEAKYLKTVIRTVIDPITYRATYVNEDTTYTNPMINQPAHLLNMTLGFDYKGFSIRWAMRYKSDIFKAANEYSPLRAFSTDFYRYDLAIKQQMPVRGLEFFLNINNLTNERENDVINHLNFSRYIEDYGRNANLGLRYQF